MKAPIDAVFYSGYRARVSGIPKEHNWCHQTKKEFDLFNEGWDEADADCDGTARLHKVESYWPYDDNKRELHLTHVDKYTSCGT